MTSTHQFTEPFDWPTADDCVDMDVYCVTSTARDVARYPGAKLVALVGDLVEAREYINDAIAKAEAHQERATMARLPLIN